MSIAEPLPNIAQKLQPYRKWYMLFPENWAKLAFELDWRAKRLQELERARKARAIGFWGALGSLSLALSLIGIENILFHDSNRPVDPRPTLQICGGLLILTATGTAYLIRELELILLQLIDRFEQENAKHG